jgi:hypothetical protein
MASLFGYPEEGCCATYTEWAMSALYSNGLDPEVIPRHLLPMVPDHPVRSGRAVSEGRMLQSAWASNKRDSLLNLASGGR